MIDVKHRYALLENGTIEPLHYSDGTLRDVYQDWDGLWYMDHEVRGTYTGRGCIAFRHDRILSTSDNIFVLEMISHAQTT